MTPDRVEALRRAWGVAPHERIVLLAARLTGWKGQNVLIEAAARLRDRGLADVAFILAGDPQGRDSYVGDVDALIGARSSPASCAGSAIAATCRRLSSPPRS